MYIPKVYGQSKLDKCPFCGMHSTSVNQQGLPVCAKHKDAILNEMKCVCGKYLAIMKGKFGVFFNCIHCGNMNSRKVFEINEVKDVSGNTEEKEEKPKSKPQTKQVNYYPKEEERKRDTSREITINSDDPRYFT
jgi:hypothetical protein